MGRLVVSESVTLDGVMEAPGFEEHRDGKNAWALNVATEDQQRYKVEELFAADAILLGRTTYQIFAAFWPIAPRDEGFADKMNRVEKYVVSTTLREATWNNTTIIRGDVAGEVAKFKERVARDILVFGSADLVDALMELDLVDELRIMVFPVVLGSGKRLFRDERDVSHLRLTGTRPFNSGVVLLTYEPGAEGPSSKYAETFAWTDAMTSSWEATREADRVLASVLFTDIVDSTGSGGVARRSAVASAARSARPRGSGGDRSVPRTARQDDRRRRARNVRCADEGAAVRVRAHPIARRLRARYPRGGPHGRDRDGRWGCRWYRRAHRRSAPRRGRRTPGGRDKDRA
jgi:dihydrofolate reductase